MKLMKLEVVKANQIGRFRYIGVELYLSKNIHSKRLLPVSG